MKYSKRHRNAIAMMMTTTTMVMTKKKTNKHGVDQMSREKKVNG